MIKKETVELLQKLYDIEVNGMITWLHLENSLRNLNLDNLANEFRDEFMDERNHVQRIFDEMQKFEIMPIINHKDKIGTKFNSAKDVYKYAYEMECHGLELAEECFLKIKELSDIKAEAIFRWFLEEHLNEVNDWRTKFEIISKLSDSELIQYNNLKEKRD